MLKILSVFGTRPEAIKMAPVVKELEKHPDQFLSRVCVTAQHRDMLDQILTVFQLVPHHDLDIMTSGQTLAALTARLFTRLDRVLDEERPDWVLAQGDTTTVMVAATVAYYHHVAFGHVEAGLRTGDIWQPWPEEGNRRIADSLASRLWAPTETARQTLLAEGLPEQKIVVTGNTVIDALFQIAASPYDRTASPLGFLEEDRTLVLITAHRRESFGATFRNICAGIKRLACQFPAHQFVYPVHPNPHVRQPVMELLKDCQNVYLIEPLAYRDFVHLMKRASLILTDSGGIQEEAPSFGIPVLVMREKTERPEGVEAGVVKLIGTSPRSIVHEASSLLTDPVLWNSMAQKASPYGDGNAAQRIVHDLVTL